MGPWPSCAYALLSCPSMFSPTDVFPTAVTVFCMAGLIAGAAVGAALTHDIALPS